MICLLALKMVPVIDQAEVGALGYVAASERASYQSIIIPSMVSHPLKPSTDLSSRKHQTLLEKCGRFFKHFLKCTTLKVKLPLPVWFIGQWCFKAGLHS